MGVSADQVFTNIMGSAGAAFGQGWSTVEKYAPAEFRKMAMQVAEIAENVALFQVDPTKGYSADTGRVLFTMQRTACESVLVALTQLTMIAVQKALDAIVAGLKAAFGAVLAGILV